MGIALVPEDRKADGLLLEESIAENLVLPGLARTAAGGIIRRRPAERAIKDSRLAGALARLAAGPHGETARFQRHSAARVDV